MSPDLSAGQQISSKGLLTNVVCNN